MQQLNRTVGKNKKLTLVNVFWCNNLANLIRITRSSFLFLFFDKKNNVLLLSVKKNINYDIL